MRRRAARSGSAAGVTVRQRRAASFDAIVRKHCVVAGWDQFCGIVPHFAGFRIEIECESGKSPRDIARCYGAVRRHGDEHAADRAFRLGMADRR